MVGQRVFTNSFDLNIFIKKKWQERLRLKARRSCTYSVGICIIARKSRSYSRGRVWAAPTKSNEYNVLFVMQKISKICISIKQLVIL